MDSQFHKQYLQEELARRCQRNPKYSLRAFSKALQLDAAALSRILSSKLIPSPKMAVKIATNLSLSPIERTFFMQSVAEAHRKKNFQKLHRRFSDTLTTDLSAEEVSNESFHIISDWYHYAILSLTYVPGFQATPEWISQELEITPLEAKLALSRLFSLGFLQEKGGKVYKTRPQTTTANKDTSTPALKTRQKQILEKAIRALEEAPIEERSQTGMTMAIDPDKIPQAKQMILDFNRQLCDFLESGERKQVYELSIALFSLQRKDKNETHSNS